MIEGKQTTRNAVEMPAAGLKLADIYYVLFRQKWVILTFIGMALIAASVVYFVRQQTLYFSDAKLLVRYVVDAKSIETGAGSLQAPSDAGDAIISAEMEILTSFDLCKDVAESIGPEKVLGLGAGSNVIAAAGAISGGLTVDNSPPRSKIIKVRFVHPDPTMCHDILQQLLDSYFKKHILVHRAASSYLNVVQQQADTLLGRIRQNEEELRRLKAQAGVLSVEDAKKGMSEQLSRLRQGLFDTQAQLAEYRSILGNTNYMLVQAEKDAADNGLSPEQVTEYRSVRALLDSLINTEFDYLSRYQYTDEHPLVKAVRKQIAENKNRKNRLEAEFPKLMALYVPLAPSVPRSSDAPLDPARRVISLEMKIQVHSNQLAQVRQEIASLDNLESSIVDVERKLQLDRQNYQHFAAGIAAAGFDAALAEAKMSNIQPIQTPSPPSLVAIKRLKYVVGAFFGLLGAGIVIAFFLELWVDNTVRRPAEFETKIRIPLFLSIPRLGLNGHAKLLPFPARAAARAEDVSPDGELHNTWAEDHPLRRYIDGLRDSTLTFFGGDPHKPKLIGITSCSDGVGVTSLAAGLAGALSETGEGNVLLLNLNLEAQAVHPFYRGELACNLTDALELDKRQSGMVLQNLYVATAGNPNDPATTNLPKQLARVVPQLRVSDYDYIVFDLPPTMPTTMTARLAGMMDLVVLVVESEKDTQETVRQASKLLARSHARVSAVLNKVRNPIPQWLHKDA